MILRALLAVVVVAQTLQAQPISDIRAAVTRALPLLQRSAGEFVAKRSCVSCHHNILPILMLHEARNRGFQIDVGVLQSVEDKTFRELRGANALDDAIQATNLNDPTPNDSYLLMAAHEAGLAPDLTLAVYARRLARWQRQGHWITSDFRPPHSSSVFMATATAVHAIQSYMPAELALERSSHSGRHGFGARTRQGGLNVDGREVDVRQVADRKLAIRYDAGTYDAGHD